MSNNNSGDWVLPAAFIVVGIIALVIWKFSQAFGLDFSTGADVLKWCVPVSVAWLALWYFTGVSFWDTWPLALMSLWPGWWPALDYWSDHSATGGMIQYGVGEPMWYAMWYSKWGVLAAIPGLGYGVPWWLKR